MKKIIIITLFSSLFFESNARIKELFELTCAPQRLTPGSVRKNFSTSKKIASPKQLAAVPAPVTMAALEDSTTNSSSSRTISIINGITKDMKTYKKHWSGHHTPARFSISINGTALPDSTAKKVPTESSTMNLAFAGNHADIEYSFDFVAMGVSYRKGTKKLRLEIPAETDSLLALFSWDDPDRLIIQDAKTNKRLAAQPA